MIKSALSAETIEDRLIVTPLLEPDTQIGPSSVDLRLGTEIVEMDRYNRSASDPRAEDPLTPVQRRVVVPLGQRIALHPGQFLLASTLEFVRLPAFLVGQVHGRSSWGRLGVQVATAAAVQAGYAGMITLQLTNVATVPVHLYPGMRLAQLFLWWANEPAPTPYESGRAKYRYPLGPQESQIPAERGELAKFEELGRRLGSAQRRNVGAPDKEPDGLLDEQGAPL
ncbi:dCTP deaminase [Georgenia sp. EYE_87]|uniref:dCTP deaminase n=1 Tax=Georgenia sp. EYE_87 TaxID=2853448 RepID=UPI0035A826E1|nr:dCTP deaminase [Georgenia sp. EYE_87]